MSTYDLYEWTDECMNDCQKMSTNSVQSTVDSFTQGEIRSVVISGLLAFLDTTRSGLLRWFNGFHDLEVAVNKENLISDNCSALADYEMALLIRMTEVFEDKPSNASSSKKSPRSLMFGVVMMKTPPGSQFSYDVRLWEALTPAWKVEGDSDRLLLNTQTCIDNITSELMESVWKACKQVPRTPTLSIVDDTEADEGHASNSSD